MVHSLHRQFLHSRPPEFRGVPGLIKATCTSLGLPLQWEKVQGPACVNTFQGISLDSIRMAMSLPEDKVRELQGLLEGWTWRQSCRKRELLSLIGKLAHACQIVWVGRLFLRRVIVLSTKAKQLDHWIHFNGEFRTDLGWWLVFLPIWNR